MIIPIIKIEISANSVAWYGAILATGSLVISILNFLKDRRKIKVKVSEGWLVPKNHPWGGDKKKIFIAAENHGKRPVVLSGVGFILSDRSSIVQPIPKNIQFPYKLNEGESVSIFFEKEDLLKNITQNKVVKYGFYSDSIGNKYKTKLDQKLLKNEE